MNKKSKRDPAARLVYVVDDDESERHNAEQLLVKSGFTTRGFKSGAELLGSLDGPKPDCIVLDVRMPRIDGIEVLEILTLRQPSIPVVMLSGKADIHEAVRAIRNGATDFIRKPPDPDELRETIMNALSGDLKVPDNDQPKGRREEILAKISPRELEVLKLLLAGESNKSIAFTLGISTRTVEVHRANLMQRLGVKSFAELIRLAVQANIDPD